MVSGETVDTERYATSFTSILVHTIFLQTPPALFPLVKTKSTLRPIVP